jgi:hypothetical protein
LDWAKIIHAIEKLLKNFKTKQGPGQKSASIVGLAHYKPACYVGWCNKSDEKAVVIKLCDIKTNVKNL